ncbi:MAG: SusD/RagB family nutrient-binding outer membrane lipoprotein [Bacteroidota bacterium]|nr:SusD/RagB family nutrient-binding outer membrane lipoprotein [Bacteroidota bacterium]
MKKIQFNSKKMKKLKTIFLSMITIVILLTTSCEDLTEINKSPNQLSASDINIKYVLTSVLSSSATNYIRGHVYGSTITLSEAMQYLQRDYIDYAGTNTFSWTPQNFSSFNSSLINSQYIVDHANGEISEGNQKFYTAAGQIMRSFYYGFMTSLWGDMPYSEAMKATEGNFTPVYDAQKDIFKGILADLKSANDLLATVTAVDGASSADIMYGGDVLKWRKFCNSLRLRFLMRLSEKSAAEAGLDAKAEFSAIVGNSSANPIFTSSSDNASIFYPGSDNATAWPGGPLGWNNRSEYYRRKPCATFVNALVTNGDPRLTTFIRPVDSQLRVSSSATGYEKLPDGQIILNVSPAQVGTTAINTLRYVGLPPAMGIPDLYNLSSLSNFNTLKGLNSTIYIDQAANPNVSYLGDIYAQDKNPLVKAVYMSYAELSFILAEGRQKGWITTGDAIEFFKQGITASLRQYAIADGSKTVYNSVTDALETFSESAFIAAQAAKYTSAADDAAKLNVLMTQKWLATFMTPEFWFDWRRTGLPNLGANLISASKGSKIPVRYQYGTDETILNKPNVTAAIGKLQPAVDDQWSKMWLLQGSNKPW